MVLSRAALGAIAAVAALAGCDESLFGTRRGATDPIADGCTERCLGDAAAEFDGSAGGTTGRWRYLEDRRDRTWSAMAATRDGRVGVDPANQITSCVRSPDQAACRALPGALLVSSAGGAAAADPAVELTIPTATVAELALHAFVAAGEPDQTIRLYRNSREDALYTATARAGVALSVAIPLDALAGDRLLVAVTPTRAGGPGAAGVALQLVATAAERAFPSQCQLAVSLGKDTTTTDAARDLCGGPAFIHQRPAGPRAALDLQPGPYPALDPAAALSGSYLTRDALAPLTPVDWSGDTTVQLWAQVRTLRAIPNDGWLYADQDPDLCGGLTLSVVLDGGGAALRLEACDRPAELRLGFAMAPFPTDRGWHFVRAVRTANRVDVCVDGAHATALDIVPGTVATSYAPHLGKDNRGTSTATLDGLIDDVRVLRGALPCP